jgi:hypothetical protein
LFLLEEEWLDSSEIRADEGAAIGTTATNCSEQLPVNVKIQT